MIGDTFIQHISWIFMFYYLKLVCKCAGIQIFLLCVPIRPTDLYLECGTLSTCACGARLGVGQGVRVLGSRIIFEFVGLLLIDFVIESRLKIEKKTHRLEGFYLHASLCSQKNADKNDEKIWLFFRVQNFCDQEILFVHLFIHS